MTPDVPMVSRLTPPTVPATPTPASAADADSPSFSALLRDSIGRVNEMTSEANSALRRVVTGETSGVTDMILAGKKAELAFNMLLEMRNKLVEAYQELQNLRV